MANGDAERGMPWGQWASWLVIGVTAATLAGLTTLACASKEPYPRSWPERRPADSGCANLAGTYYNRGAAGKVGGESLASWLLGGARVDGVDSARLSVTGSGRLAVELLGSAGPRALALREGDASCRAGTLRIRAGARWTGNSGFNMFWIGRESHTLELQSAGDWLVVCRKTTVKAVLMVVPWRSTVVRWARFQRVPDEGGEGRLPTTAPGVGDPRLR